MAHFYLRKKKADGVRETADRDADDPSAADAEIGAGRR